MEQILSLLYGVSGITASALYIPQIMKYRRDPDACRSISLVTWSGWIAVAAVTVVYALLVLKSYLVATVAATGLLAQCTVVFYALNARLAKPAPVLPQSGGIADSIAYPDRAMVDIGN